MTTRRSFLKGILAAAMAPAIVKASSLMPIYVPKKVDIVIPSGLPEEFTIESWMKPIDDGWSHVAIVRNSTDLKYYINGVEKDYTTLKSKGFDIIQSTDGQLKTKIANTEVLLIPSTFNGHVQDLKISSRAYTPYIESNIPELGIFLG